MFEPQDWEQLVAGHAPPNALFVAEDPGHGVVGYSAAEAKTGELFLLFVDPAHSGRGIGRGLLDAAHEALRDQGHTEVFLFTEERNTRAQAVYVAAGYRPDGNFRESSIHDTPIREVRMVKAI